MKKLVMAALLVGAMAAAIVAGTALAAGPVYQGVGPGQGIHTPGTGLAGTTPAVPANGVTRGMGRWAAGQPNGQAQAGQSGQVGCPCTGGLMGAGMRGGAPEWAGLEEEVATLLSMTQEQIQSERLAGKSLVQIAAAKNVNEQTLTSTILTAKKAELDAQVAAGKLTQAQADAVYAHMQTQVPAMINRTTVGPNPNRGTGPLAGQRMSGRWAK